MLGGMFGGATSAASTIPPVISVNGQVYGAGQTVDLSQFIGPEALAQVRSSLEQLGLGGQLAGLFGGTAAASGSMRPPAALGAGPGPAPALPYTTTPGEVTGSGNKTLVWLAALLVLGLMGVIAYLMITG